MSEDAMPAAPPALRRAATIWLGYVLVVIAGGAFVRATGSGAGCGASWPTCDGEIVPLGPTFRTWVEYTHRALSGIAWLGALGWWLGLRRVRDRYANASRYAGFAFLFMSLEAAIGAALVLLELVASNISLARAVWMAGHLLNTFLLLWMIVAMRAALTAPARRLAYRVFQGRAAVATVAFLLASVTGAVAALGDTLWLQGAAPQSAAETEALATLMTLRLLHPFTSLATSAVLVACAVGFTRAAGSRQAGLAVLALVAGQLVVGVGNIWLQAPVAVQLLHLLLADLMWLALCWASFFTHPASAVAGVETPSLAGARRRSALG